NARSPRSVGSMTVGTSDARDWFIIVLLSRYDATCWLHIVPDRWRICNPEVADDQEGDRAARAAEGRVGRADEVRGAVGMVRSRCGHRSSAPRRGDRAAP